MLHTISLIMRIHAAQFGHGFMCGLSSFILRLTTKKFQMICGCRCIECKSQQLESFSFFASDGFEEMHHTCLSCGIHFNHLDGDTHIICQACNYTQPKKKREPEPD